MGNWLVDSVKFIDVYPAKGNLTTITDVEVGLAVVPTMSLSIWHV